MNEDISDSTFSNKKLDALSLLSLLMQLVLLPRKKPKWWPSGLANLITFGEMGTYVQIVREVWTDNATVPYCTRSKLGHSLLKTWSFQNRMCAFYYLFYYFNFFFYIFFFEVFYLNF